MPYIRRSSIRRRGMRVPAAPFRRARARYTLRKGMRRWKARRNYKKRKNYAMLPRGGRYGLSQGRGMPEYANVQFNFIGTFSSSPNFPLYVNVERLTHFQGFQFSIQEIQALLLLTGANAKLDFLLGNYEEVKLMSVSMTFNPLTAKQQINTTFNDSAGATGVNGVGSDSVPGNQVNLLGYDAPCFAIIDKDDADVSTLTSLNELLQSHTCRPLRLHRHNVIKLVPSLKLSQDAVSTGAAVGIVLTRTSKVKEPWLNLQSPAGVTNVMYNGVKIGLSGDTNRHVNLTVHAGWWMQYSVKIAFRRRAIA